MTKQFKPNATVAAVIKSDEKYLFVKELDEGRLVINQPAGHVEENESIIDAIKREIREETGLTLNPDSIVGIYYFCSQFNATYYLRFCFYIEVNNQLECTPQDDDIIEGVWLTKEELLAKKPFWRSELVWQCIVDSEQENKTSLNVLKNLI